MREALLTELLAAMDEVGAPISMLQSAKERFSKVISRYTVDKATTDLALRDGLPSEVAWFLVAKKTDGLAQATLARYSMSLGRFFRSAMKQVRDVEANDIRVWIYNEQESGAVSNRTLDGYRRVVCTFFRWCADEGYIDTNPAKNIRKIKYEERKQDRLTLEELTELRDACDTTRKRATLEIYYSTGMRCSELATVKVEDVDLRQRTINVYNQKSRRDKVCYLTEQAAYWVAKWLKERKDQANEWLFYNNRTKGQSNRNAMLALFRDLKEKTGITKQVSPIVLRRSMATHALNNDCNVVDVMKMLDHRNPKTTLIYAERYNDRIQSAHDMAIA